VALAQPGRLTPWSQKVTQRLRNIFIDFTPPPLDLPGQQATVSPMRQEQPMRRALNVRAL
jgi:hypothetical protein